MSLARCQHGLVKVLCPHCQRNEEPGAAVPECRHCGAACQYYGEKGGYSVACEPCNVASAAAQRRLRESRKEGAR